MSTTLKLEPASMPPKTRAAEKKPQPAVATCLQEQFCGPLPARSERSMAEILVERQAEAGPESPCALFVP